MTTSRPTLHCACSCGRRTKSPALDRWVEVTDWGVLSADDPRGPEAAIEWFATAKCWHRCGERRLRAATEAVAR